jgi:D-alanine-D-alanine ligase
MTVKSQTNSPSLILKSQLKVAVLTGGIGEERAISIQSGNCVARALKETGLNVITADIRPDDLSILDETSIDVFFIALHGKFGEDGRLQQILEDKSLVYTGSGPKASELAFDKMASKKAFAKAGITTPPAIEFDSNVDIQKFEKQLREFADRYVIKPLRQGSSVGVSIVDDCAEAIAAARKCWNEFGDCMIEEFVPGRDITVGILCGQALPIIEIRPKENFYNYHAKYVDEQTAYLFDTIEPALASKVQADALGCFNTLKLRHFARVDFILGDNKRAYALEANAIPGMTVHSLLPKAAARAGLSMSDLCIRIIEAALEDAKVRKF